MGAVKDYLLMRLEEENGVSVLGWGQIRQVLQHLAMVYPAAPTLADVQDNIDKLTGESGIDDLRWTDVRQVLNNLSEVWFSDLSLSDLICQIEGLGPEHPQLADEVEQHREDEEFEDLLSRD
jgi:hypothetical protein